MAGRRSTSRLGRTVAVWLMLTGVGCAARPSVRVDARAVTSQRAGDLAGQGCYEPMVEALQMYQTLLAEREDPAVRARAFEVATLVALRERLLGLYPGHYQDSPVRLATGLTDPRVTAALEVLDLAAWRQGTRPTRGMPRFDAIRARAFAAYQVLDPLAAGDTFSAVLLVYLLSTHPLAKVPPGTSLNGIRLAALSFEAEPWAKSHMAVPTFAFTWMTVQRGSPEEWQVWLEERPACADAGVPIADAALARGRLVSADAALGQAIEALPALVPARVMRGEIRTKLEDHVGALTQFDEVVRRVPDHREARLGQLIALSGLMRHDAALAVADEMIALGEWYLGEAFYWKAWNLLQRGQLADAEVALVEAKRLLFNADVHYLGALIAYRQERWAEARAELTRTLAADSAHCDAQFTLGAVELIERQWSTAESAFDQATECLAMREPGLAAAVAEVDTAELPDEHKAALRQRRQAALDATVEQKHWARYNRAVALSNVGDRERARALADEVVQRGGRPGAAAADLLRQLAPPTRQAPPDG